ncbi:hypothetical protein Zmor_005571 [Zophobas morio]|uniref:Uncharacterized protein n=1 Tax=Zophobas morio TaxID=2755281 RepID=A0AA38MLW9_9CUCU|nr:hypothetical protein Zmor_005571 [Zophobas morio]
MGSSMYGDDDSLSVRMVEGKPGSGSREWVLQTSLEAVTEAVRKGLPDCLNRGYFRERVSLNQQVKSRQRESSQITLKSALYLLVI